MVTSRIPGFHRLSPQERARLVSVMCQLAPEEESLLARGLDREGLSGLSENVVGVFPLPLSVATNFIVNGKERLVPMAIEESSVVAAASYAALIARPHGGFRASAGGLMAAQIALRGIPPSVRVREILSDRMGEILERADRSVPGLKRRGGGARFLRVRRVETPRGNFVVVHLLVDTVDAMGANALNTMAEEVAPFLGEILGGEPFLKILTNLCDERMARAEAIFDRNELGGDRVVEGILDAWALATSDPYRAATHNKGALNGMGAVALATGNDWRALEAAAHAFAARTGRYSSLTKFERTPEGHLRGAIELPLSVGTVGGATRAHPLASLSLKILGIERASELASVIASVGLAQNVAALRALVSEGIQEGHMRLHARAIALAAGATPKEVEEVAERLRKEGEIRLSRAQEIIEEIRRGSPP